VGVTATKVFVATPSPALPLKGGEGTAAHAVATEATSLKTESIRLGRWRLYRGGWLGGGGVGQLTVNVAVTVCPAVTVTVCEVPPLTEQFWPLQLLGEMVPPGLAATAQAIYGTVAIGAVTSLLTLLSGTLYGRLGAGGFWAMAALCLCAMPFISQMAKAEPG